MLPYSFNQALEAIKLWLEANAGELQVRRDSNMPAQWGAAWYIDLSDEALPVKWLRLWLPPEYPVRCCEIYVDPGHFLRIPHVEASGRVCLGVAEIPQDYDDPIYQVSRALGAFQDQLLANARDPYWTYEQFESEAITYWSHMCDYPKGHYGRRALSRVTHVDASGVDRWAFAALAAYIPAKSRHWRFDKQIVVSDGHDPHAIAQRHGWAAGTLVRGDAVIIRLPEQMPWGPHKWPMDFWELAELVAMSTDRELLLTQWLARTGWRSEPEPGYQIRERRGNTDYTSRPISGHRPLLVLLMHESSLYGYQLLAPMLARLTPPHIEPIKVNRIDADWALARDHELSALARRRSLRVLVLGCGSLGSSLITMLARAGVGHMDIVDAQLMQTENTARHELGMADHGQPKASCLANRLRRDIPSIMVRGFQDEVQTWCAANCRPGNYDLVVECTAESSVRTWLAYRRDALFGACPLIHAWTEPLCSAGHVVVSQPEVPWPTEDPADWLVNASDLSGEDMQVRQPACGGGFHPYGAADIAQVAAFAAERVIALLDDLKHPSVIWSWVRATAFFEQLPGNVRPRAIVPISMTRSDSATVTRDLAVVLGEI